MRSEMGLVVIGPWPWDSPYFSIIFAFQWVGLRAGIDIRALALTDSVGRKQFQTDSITALTGGHARATACMLRATIAASPTERAGNVVIACSRRSQVS